MNIKNGIRRIVLTAGILFIVVFFCKNFYYYNFTAYDIYKGHIFYHLAGATIYSLIQVIIALVLYWILEKIVVWVTKGFAE